MVHRKKRAFISRAVYFSYSTCCMKPVSVSRSAAAEYLRQDINSKSEAERLLASLNDDSDDDVDDFIRNINNTVNSTKTVEDESKIYCFDQFIAPIRLLQHQALIYKNNPIKKPVLPPNSANSDKIQLLINCFDSLDSIEFALRYNLFSAWSFKTKLLIPDYVMSALFENIFNIDDNDDIFKVISDLCIKNQTKWTPSYDELKKSMNNLHLDDEILTFQSNKYQVKSIESNQQNQEILTFFNLNFINKWLLMISSVFCDNLSSRISPTFDIQRLLNILQCLLIISLDNSIHNNGEAISACHIAISRILTNINQYLPSDIVTCECSIIATKQKLPIDHSNQNLNLVLNFWRNIISKKLLRLADLNYMCSMLPIGINRYLVHDIYDSFLNRLIEESNFTKKEVLSSHGSNMPMKIISIVRAIRSTVEYDTSKVDGTFLSNIYILLAVVDNIVKNCGELWFQIPSIADDDKMDEYEDLDEKILNIFQQVKHECSELYTLLQPYKNQKVLGHIDILEHTFKCAKKIHENSV